MPAGSLEERFPPTPIIGLQIDHRLKAFVEVVERFSGEANRLR